jgi:tol-pal system protein YbgF
MKWRPSAIPMVAIFFASMLAALLSGCAAGPHAPRSTSDMQRQLAANQAMISELQQQVATLQKQASEQAAQLAAMRTAMGQMQDTGAPAAGGKAQRELNQIEPSLNEPASAAGEIEKNAYSAAYLALKSGRYDEASQDFASLIKAYPKGEYIDQALYWYGESLYAQHRLKQAAKVLEQLVRQHPKSAKRAPALFRLGSIYKDLHRTGDAVVVFKRLIREYPHSGMATKARRDLNQIEQEKKK